jgi:Cu+-exporting ATPase
MAECVHCGQDCGKNPVIWNEKPFCCNGCSMVFQILSEKKLSQYYEIMPTPGIKLEQEASGSRYAYLDSEQIAAQLLDFSDGGISRVNFFIPAIHCSSCIWLLENLQTLHNGVIHSHVNFVRKEVSITFRDTELSIRQLVELLHAIHYIPDLSSRRNKKDEYQKANRRLVMKIGVAGFAFGNIMLLSFPDYLPGGETIDKLMAGTFGIVSFLLALPVVTFCSSGFFLSAFKSLRKKVINIDLPLSIGILALFIESSYEIFSGAGTGYMDSLAGLLFFMLIGRWYQSRTYQSLSFDRDYRSYFPIAVTRINETGDEEYVQLSDLQPGNTILVRNSELIPVDSVLLSGEGSIDYSFVTGESVPVTKKEGDFVFAGGKQTAAAITLRVEKEVEQSYLTQLWNEDKLGGNQQMPMQSVVNKVSHYFTIVILLIATIAGVYWSLTDLGKAVYVFASILIVACPCALSLTIPFTFGNVMRVFGRSGFYIKNADVIEKITQVDQVVFDKTGTLTYSRSINIAWEGDTLTDQELAMIRKVAGNSTHPLSVMLHEWLTGTTEAGVEGYREIAGLGISGVVDGNQVMLGSQKFIKGSDEGDSKVSTVYVSINHKYKGFFRFGNQYRDGLDKVIGGFSKVKMHLLTGDNNSEKDNLKLIFPEGTELRFNQTPHDKLAYIQQLSDENKHTLMIGDGLNDAGALLKAHVGITIADDIYHFSPACDAIMRADKFAKLHQYFRFTHSALGIVYASYSISFLYNIVGLFFASQGMLSPVFAAILMPLSSITVVSFSSLSVAILSRLRKI